MELYTINQVSERMGVSVKVVRGLCNSGLVPFVKRGRRGVRMFEDWQVNHIAMVLALRNAGMRKPELKRYARLVRKGKESLPERKAMLETYKCQLWQELEDIQRGIDVAERQVEIIDKEIM